MRDFDSGDNGVVQSQKEPLWWLSPQESISKNCPQGRAQSSGVWTYNDNGYEKDLRSNSYVRT